MGPTCEVLLNDVYPSTLDAIDSKLTEMAEQIIRTRKGRSWDVWINTRPMHLAVTESPSAIVISAGCNEAVDFVVLKQLSEQLAFTTDGIASTLEN